MIKPNKNLIFFSGVLVALGLFVLVTLQKFLPFLSHATYYCQSFINNNVMPIPYVLSILPVVLLLFIVIVSIAKFLFLTYKVHYLKNSLKDNVVVKKSVEEILVRLNLDTRTVIINSNKKFAFCLGMKNPKIYVSTGLISYLTLPELESVLLHEQYHLENHDTFTMIIASVANLVFPAFPIIKDLIQKYRIEREVQADKFAIERMGVQYPLVSALKKLISFPTVKNAPVLSIADQDTLEPRIFALLDRPYIKRKLRIKNTIVTVCSLTVVGVSIVAPVQAREIHHEEHDVVMVCTNGECMNSCTSDQNMNKLNSEIPEVKGTQSYSSLQ